MKLSAIVSREPPVLGDNPIIVDSDYLPDSPCLERFDHHLEGDNGWTNLDSIREKDLVPLLATPRLTIVTSYLDPDAIISTAFLRYSLEHGGAVDRTLDTSLGRQLYAASFFADYNTACPFLDSETNTEGSKIELWLRKRMSLALGETRGAKAPKGDAPSSVLRLLADDILEMLLLGRQTDPVARFDAAAYLDDLAAIFSKYIKHDSGTSTFGVIHVPTTEEERVIPRAYLSAFRTPAVVRVIESKNPVGSRQVFIGVNPSVRGWKDLNLLRLRGILSARSKAWQMDGRRAVIGIDSTIENVESLFELLTDLEPKDFQDACPNQSRLERKASDV